MHVRKSPRRCPCFATWMPARGRLPHRVRSSRVAVSWEPMESFTGAAASKFSRLRCPVLYSSMHGIAIVLWQPGRYAAAPDATGDVCRSRWTPLQSLRSATFLWPLWEPNLDDSVVRCPFDADAGNPSNLVNGAAAEAELRAAPAQLFPGLRAAGSSWCHGKHGTTSSRSLKSLDVR